MELSSARATPEYAERSQTVIEAIIKAVAEQGPHGAVAAPMTDEQLVDAQLVGMVPFPKSPWLNSQPLPGSNAAPMPDVQLLELEPLANVPGFARQPPPAAAAASGTSPEPTAPEGQVCKTPAALRMTHYATLRVQAQVPCAGHVLLLYWRRLLSYIGSRFAG